MKLNNIIRISVVPLSLIGEVTLVSLSEARLGSEVPFRDLSAIKKPAQLTIADKIEDKVRLFQSKLVFYSCEDALVDLDRSAFLCEAIDGKRYLIGTGDRPYPVVTQQENHPSNGSDSQLTEVTVTWTCTKRPPIII